MLKKYTYDELQPYAEKLKQMALDDLVGSFDIHDAEFYILSTANGTEDTTTYNLLCPDCHETFTIDLENSWRRKSPVCPHCGFSSSSERAIQMYEQETHFNHVNNKVYAIREGDVIIAGVCNAFATLVDNGSKFELVPDKSDIYSIIAFGPEKATYFKYDGSNEPKKMKYDKHAADYFKEIYPSWRYRHAATPVNPLIKSWMDDFGFKDFNDVVNFYKAKRKAPVITKASIDPSRLREYDFTDVFEHIKDKLVTFVYREYDAVKKIEKSFYWCEHCKREFVAEEDSNGRYYGRYGDNKVCPYCKNENSIHITPSADNDSDLGVVALFQDYNDANIHDGVVGRMYKLSVFTTLDGDNRPFYEFHVGEHHGGAYYSSSSCRPSYAVLFDHEKGKLSCFSNVGGVYDNESIREFNSMGYKSLIVDATKGSWLSYIGMEEYHKAIENSRRYYGCNGMVLTRYLQNVAKYPVIEKMVKVGFGGVVERALNSVQTDAAYTGFIDLVNGKDHLDEVFGFPVKMANKLHDYIHDMTDIFYFRKLYELDKTAAYEDYVYAKENSFHSVSSVFEIVKGITLKSIHAYMEGVRVHQCFPPNEAFGFWRDYLWTCNELGMDISDKQVKFPNSLKREHDKAIAKRKFVFDEEKNAAFMEQTKRSQELYGHETKEFIIRAPKDTKELFEEGRILSHSVGSYTDMITRGDTCIMFVRKASEPDKPWYTLEIAEKDNSIPEIKGYCNRLVDEEMEVPLCKFLVKWADHHKLDIDNALRTSKKIRAILAAEKKSGSSAAA